MTRIALLCFVFLLLFPSSVFSQDIAVGIYADPGGASCDITDTGTALLNLYVVVVFTSGIEALRFSALPPACADLIYLAETTGGVIISGLNSQTGINLGLGGCVSVGGFESGVAVMNLTFFSATPAQTCCQYAVLADPSAMSGLIEATDCNGVVRTANDSSAGLFNSDGTCQCQGDIFPPFLPVAPSPPHLDANVPIDCTLRWLGDSPYDVYFGTSQNPPLVSSGQSAREYTPSLSQQTEYFWRIVGTDTGGNPLPGPTWSFTTEGTVPTEEASWGSIKALFHAE